MDFIYEIAGVQQADQNLRSVFHNEAGDIEFIPAGVRITGKIGMDHTIFGTAFEFPRDTAATAAPDTTPKLTIPRPAWSTPYAEATMVLDLDGNPRPATERHQLLESAVGADGFRIR